MEKPKFEVGKVYTNGNENIQLQFVGINKHGGKVFKSLNGISPFRPYSKENEEKDPMCKEGYIGFSMGNGLKKYHGK